MFREMRRKNQRLSQEETALILSSATSGVLAVLGDEGYPYAVPVSHVYEEGRLYFHCAKAGHKLDAIKNCEKVSFCVIQQDQVVPKEYTTYFRSAIAFGRIRILEGEEAWAAMEKLAARFTPDDTPQGRHAAIEKSINACCVLEFTIEHLTGKESIELVRGRSNKA